MGRSIFVDKQTFGYLERRKSLILIRIKKIKMYLAWEIALWGLDLFYLPLPDGSDFTKMTHGSLLFNIKIQQ